MAMEEEEDRIWRHKLADAGFPNSKDTNLSRREADLLERNGLVPGSPKALEAIEIDRYLRRMSFALSEDEKKGPFK